MSGGLARYTANGVLDNTFGIAGIAAVNTPNLLSSLALQDGKIIAAGAQVTRTTNRKGVTTITRTFALSRYLANGAIDTTFGSSGLVTTAFASSTEATIFNIAIQSDNKIVAVGKTGISFFTPNFLAMARYNR